MNKVILMGRLTKDPDVRYSQANPPVAVARYSLAVHKRFKKEGEQDADFINCIALGKNGEFAEKFLKKGMQISIVGRIQTGSYTDKNGKKVYTTDVVVEEHYFAESKNCGQATNNTSSDSTEAFYPIDENVADSDLPF